MFEIETPETKTERTNKSNFSRRASIAWVGWTNQRFRHTFVAKTRIQLSYANVTTDGSTGGRLE